MSTLLAIALLAIVALLVAGLALLWRVREQLDVIALQLSERRGWERKG